MDINNPQKSSIEFLKEVLQKDLDSLIGTNLYYTHQANQPIEHRVCDPQIDLEAELIHLRSAIARYSEVLAELNTL